MNYLIPAILVCFSQVVLFGQTDTTADSALNLYLAQVNSIVSNSDLALEEYIKSLPINDLISLVNKRERIYEQDLYRLKEYTRQNRYIYFNEQEGNYVKFGIFEKMIDNRITELYGSAIKELITNPVLLRVKIINRKSESIKVTENRNPRQTIITAEIQDIVKGEKHYNTGDSIIFYYMDFWLRESKVKLTDNDTYFVTLFPVEDNNGNKLLGLNINEGLLKISHDIILDEKNYYGFGNISWPDFKRKIIYKISIDNLMNPAHKN